jgi:hypothetical protein
MKTRMPSVALEGDNGAQAAHGALMGFSRQRAVWCFGFTPGGDLGVAFGVVALRPLWALTIHNGTVLETYLGPWGAPPPSRFRNILEADLDV